MFDFIKLIGAFASNFVWIAIFVLAVFSALCFFIERFVGGVRAVVPWLPKAGTAAGLLAGLLLLIKVVLFIMGLLSSQAQLADMKGKLDAKDQRIQELTETAERKATQAAEVNTSDTKAEVIYRNKYTTIEKIVREPDLSLANRLALDLTVGFFNFNGESDATNPPSN